MLLDTNTAITETNCTLTGNTFSIKASPIAFDILSAKLYSNPILAIVRELITNAYDSHIAAGKIDTPITVEVPNSYNPNFKIRDYGTGLSKDDVLQLYTTFFDSTKSTSNKFTGCFGLGSKTPFAYTSIFAVNSYYNGTLYMFVATKKDGYPSIFCAKEVPTTEENGLEISIPVQSEDCIKFEREFKKYIRFIPELKFTTNTNPERPNIIIKQDNVSIYESNETSQYTYPRNNGVIYIKQGQNTYNIENYPLFDNNKCGAYNFIDKVRYHLHVIIEVPIGTFGITPSRESLLEDEHNNEVMKTILKKAEQVIINIIMNHADSNNSLMTLSVSAVNDKYLHDFNNKLDSAVTCNLFCTYREVNANINCRDVVFTRINYDTDTISKHDPFCLGKNLIILVPAGFKYDSISKLSTTLSNYPEFKQYERIYTCTMPKHDTQVDSVFDANTNKHVHITKRLSTSYYSGRPVLGIMRDIYNAVYLLNNLPKYAFDIEITSINKLYRTYTNHKKAITKKVAIIDKYKNFRYKNYTCTKENNSYLGVVYTKYVCSSPYGREETYSQFSYNHHKERTIITTKDDIDSLLLVLKGIAGIQISSNNDKTLFEEYIDSLTTDTFSYKGFTIVAVSKVNIKYFSEYIIYNHKDFKNFVLNQDTVFKFIHIPEYIGTMLNNFDEELIKSLSSTSLWTPQIKDAVMKSSYYNYIKRLYDIIKDGQFRPYAELEKIQTILDSFNCKDKLIINNLTRLENNNVLKQLSRIWEQRSYQYSYSSKSRGYIASRFDLSKKQKLNLLQLLLYGRIKYAVL